MIQETKFEVMKGKIVTKTFLFFSFFVVLMVIFLVIRFTEGLGAVTNLSNGYPWGIWIAYDVVVGSALGCGGYALAILIYILNKREFSPLMRSALLTSALGYTMAGFSVIIDLGRYWNTYGFFIPARWNTSSVLFEVAVCIMAYTLVLWVELTPVVAERTGWDREKIEKIVMVAAVLGLILPTLHQSSLGSIHLISLGKLHPLWHSGFLPLYFLSSVILMGYAVTAAESLISSYYFRRPYETRLLRKLSIYMVYIGIGWVIMRFLELLLWGKIKLVFTSGFLSLMFWIEIFLFVFPSVLLWQKRHELTPRKIFVYSIMYLFAGALYRFNVYLIAWNPGNNWVYFPSFMETMITIGIVSFEFMIYLVFVKTFPVFPAKEV